MQINTCYNEVCRQASLKAQHVEPELKMVINQMLFGPFLILLIIIIIIGFFFHFIYEQHLFVCLSMTKMTLSSVLGKNSSFFTDPLSADSPHFAQSEEMTGATRAFYKWSSPFSLSLM